MTSFFIPEQLPIKNINYQELLPHISRANRELGGYDSFLSVVPNPDTLAVSLERQEALDSNKIEGSRSTMDEVLLSEAGQIEESDDLQEILNYRQALLEAQREFASGRPFNLNLLKNLHSILLDSVRGKNKARGEFRHVPDQHDVWIGPPGSTKENAKFVPPAPADVSSFMSDWEKYYHSTEPEVLVQLAVVHAQFELIHPFLDGNGRIGRLLIPIFLHEKEIIQRPFFYMSSYLELKRSDYMELLNGLGAPHADWTEWIRFFLQGIAEQAAENTEKSKALLNLYGELTSKFFNVTNSKNVAHVLEAMFKMPVFTAKGISRLINEAGETVLQATLNALLKNLLDKKCIDLLQAGKGRTPNIYCLEPLRQLLVNPQPR